MAARERLAKTGDRTGSAILQRIAAPMVGGMITAPLPSMFVTRRIG